MECVTCVCVWLGVVWVERGMRELGLGFTNPVGTGGVLDMYLCFGCGCVGDALILCRLVGFAVNPFDRPPQLVAVGPVVYALNKFSPLFSCVIRYRIGDLIIHCRQPGGRRDSACIGRLASPSRLRSPLGLVACKAYVFQ